MDWPDKNSNFKALRSLQKARAKAGRQNVDKSPKGTGKGLPEVQNQYENSYQGGQTSIDVWTFMISDWNKKAPGQAGAEDFKEE